MPQDFGFDSFSTGHLLEGKIAGPGEFSRKIEESCFNQSRILKKAAMLVDAGQFTQAV